ncbi:MAG: amidohydrolase family protein [Chitinophagaceae bacterium]|nr:amidohydrolase family protein [Chitinophagaceae bacterium]
MAFQKFKAGKLFDGYRFTDDDKVLITDEAGVIEDIIAETEAGDDIQRYSGILSPGFINCHCHLELSHMKGLIPEGKGLVKFVLDVLQLRHFPEEDILQAIEKAEDEMIANGIVAVGDICNNTLTIPQKSKGRIPYHNFIEASGFNPQIAVQRFQKAKNIYEKYRDVFFSKIQYPPFGAGSIVPHAPYSVSDELWGLIIHFPGNHLLTIHNQETVGENEWFMNKQGAFTELFEKMNIDGSFFIPSGKSSLQTYLPKFLNTQSVILVHNVHTSEEDILFAKNSGQPLHWCLCPNANQYITGQMPDIYLLMKLDCEIVLGTDSLASNHQLSILEEIKTIQQHFPHIEIDKILSWATSNGAKALQMNSMLGSFEKGKKPGVVLLEQQMNSLQRLT